METSQIFALKSHDVVAEDFDGDFVVLDLASGKYFSLTSGAAIVWRAVLAGHSIDSLCAGLPDADPRRSGAQAVLASLVGNELIKPVEGTATGAPELAAEFAAAPGPYTIEVFEDLADLLVADPIHEVDAEAGWPHRPPQG